MRKTFFLAVAAVAMITISSCEREQTVENASPKIGVEVSASVSEDTKTKVTATDGSENYIFDVEGEEIILSQSISDIEAEISQLSTKGRPIKEAGDDFNRFTLSILKDDGTQYHAPTEVTYDSATSEWSLKDEVSWPEDKTEVLKFYASNINTAGESQTVSETFPAGGGMQISYRDAGAEGSAADGESDLLYAYARASQSEARERTSDLAVDLQFHHALAGLKFKFGDITNNLTLTGVSLGGIVTDGECLYKDDKLSWTPGTTVKVLSQSLGTTTAEGSECDPDGETGTKKFFIVPQDIPADATLTFTLEYDMSGFAADTSYKAAYPGGEAKKVITKTFKFSDISSTVTSWEAGKMYTYTLSTHLYFAELGKKFLSIFKVLSPEGNATSVKKISFSAGESPVTKGQEVQSSRSLTPIYATYDSDAAEIVLHTAAPKIFLQPDSHELFDSMHGVTEIDGLDILDTRNVTSMAEMFSCCTSLLSLDLSSFDTSGVTDMNSMFLYCSALQTLTINKIKFNTSKVTDMSYMFRSCSQLDSIDLSVFNTSKVTDMSSMFRECQSLSTIDLKAFVTSNVTSMQCMFDFCKGITSLDISGFDTANVTDMNAMFAYCSNLTSVKFPQKFNTSKVTSMKDMFTFCSSLTDIDLTSFDTANVTDFSWMFYDCEKLKSLDLSSFNTEKATTMNYMFGFSKNLGNVKFGTSFVMPGNNSSMCWGMGSAVSPSVTITCTQATKDSLLEKNSSGSYITGINSKCTSWTWNIIQ